MLVGPISYLPRTSSWSLGQLEQILVFLSNNADDPKTKKLENYVIRIRT